MLLCVSDCHLSLSVTQQNRVGFPSCTIYGVIYFCLNLNLHLQFQQNINSVLDLILSCHNPFNTGTEHWYGVRCSLYLKSDQNFMDIKSWPSFTVRRRMVVELMAVAIGKRSPRWKVLGVKLCFEYLFFIDRNVLNSFFTMALVNVEHLAVSV